MRKTKRIETEHIREYLVGMTDKEAIEWLLEQLAEKVSQDWDHVASLQSHFPKMALQPLYILNILIKAQPRIVTYGKIAENIERQTGGYPDTLNIQSSMRHVRKALRLSDLPITISSYYGIGYNVSVPKGWVAPWETIET